MARVSLPRASSVLPAVPRLLGLVRTLFSLLLVAGCASPRPDLTTAPEVAPTGVGSRVLIPRDLDVNPTETVIKPGSSGGNTSAPLTALELAVEQTAFGLREAIAFALQHNPRLRSARAVIERARGQEQVAFAPFLPQIDILGQYGGTSGTLAPGIPGPTGFLVASGVETRSYAQTELALQWTLYDFGRTSGRYCQAVSRERITELQLARAGQTVEFDVTVAYTDVLLARASRRVQEDAVRQAEATLNDTAARRRGGVALKDDVLRAEVQLSESREALVLAREGEFNALARLNYTMGRNAGWPLEVIDLEPQRLPPGALADLLELAAAERPEISLARHAVAAAQEGRQAARGEFLPRVFVRAVAGRADGQGILTGWQEGAGLHVESPLYAGGRHQGDMRSAEAEIEGALADAQAILDAISLQVNLAYRGVVAARERIELARTAVVQAEENLRLVRVRYRNGNAIPTEIVDSEAALTRSQQRFFSANYSYLAALARLDYALGQRQGASLDDSQHEERTEVEARADGSQALGRSVTPETDSSTPELNSIPEVPAP
jgi:outer membrane protein TolC